MSDRERIQFQKFRLLNYSPPAAGAGTTVMTTMSNRAVPARLHNTRHQMQQQNCIDPNDSQSFSAGPISLSISVERRRTSAGVITQQFRDGYSGNRVLNDMHNSIVVKSNDLSMP